MFSIIKLSSKPISLLSILLSIVFVSSCEVYMKKAEKDTVNQGPQYLLIGTYTQKEGHVDGKAEGIYFCEYDSTKGSIEIINVIKGIINPSYAVVHPTKDVIYAVSEQAGKSPMGQVFAYSFDRNKKEFKQISTQSTFGNAPCHLFVDSKSSRLYVVNYMGGILNYNLNNDGSIDGQPQIISYDGGTPGSARQEAPHPHMIKRVNDFVYVTDLGTDEVITFDIKNNGLLEENSRSKTTDGGGPRHFIESNNGATLYIVNELDLTIQVFSTSSDGSEMKVEQTISLFDSLIDTKGHSGSAIKIHPSGMFLYAGLRAQDGSQDNSIQIFKIDQNSGFLSHLDAVNSKGNVPRDFEISLDGKFLLVGNQNSDNIITYEIDQNSGKLNATNITSQIMTPVSIKFFN